MKDIKEILKTVPMLTVFATASLVKPNATVSEVVEGPQEFDLLEIHKMGSRQVVSQEEIGLSGNFTCICPFHNDTSEGSLVITSNFGNKNLWKCFACGAGLDAIDFEMKYFNLDFQSAVKHLAYRLGYSSDSVQVASKPTKKKPSKKVVEAILADEDVISSVYRTIQKLYPLTEGHKKHLKSVRGLWEEDFINFFSFPNKDADIAKDVYEYFLNALSIKFYDKNHLKLNEDELNTLKKHPSLQKLMNQFKYVPGFYLNKRTGKVEWIYKSGIGILAVDDLGLVRGIQVQNMAPNSNAPKYVWWSSQVKLGENGFEGGSSAGSPGGVIFPKVQFYRRDIEVKKDPSIIVTEGRYKAESIAKEGNIAVYVSGVSTWSSIIPIIERLKGDRDKIYIAFDADTLGNMAVYSQLKQMSESFATIDLKPIVLLWSKSLGKGFDDMKASCGFINYKKYLKAVPFNEFSTVVETSLKQLLKEMGFAELRDVPKEHKKYFGKKLQENVESAFKLKNK